MTYLFGILFVFALTVVGFSLTILAINDLTGPEGDESHD
jgi:hypothetical protein